MNFVAGLTFRARWLYCGQHYDVRFCCSLRWDCVCLLHTTWSSPSPSYRADRWFNSGRTLLRSTRAVLAAPFTGLIIRIPHYAGSRFTLPRTRTALLLLRWFLCRAQRHARCYGSAPLTPAAAAVLNIVLPFSTFQVTFKIPPYSRLLSRTRWLLPDPSYSHCRAVNYSPGHALGFKRSLSFSFCLILCYPLCLYISFSSP